MRMCMSMSIDMGIGMGICMGVCVNMGMCVGMGACVRVCGYGRARVCVCVWAMRPSEPPHSRGTRMLEVTTAHVHGYV